MMRMLRSWGHLRAVPVDLSEPRWRDQLDLSSGPALAWGLGRSYGDSCLLENGRMIAMHGLDRILGFCPRTERLEAEAGISLDEILRFSVPRGWFLPTTPGTRQVTLGGAIANDVHGKNHHRAGCFGNHVPALELLRSDGSRTTVREGDPLHSAKVGGMGLTGLITRAEVRLAPISSASLDAGNPDRLSDAAADLRSRGAVVRTIATEPCDPSQDWDAVLGDGALPSG